MHYKLLHLFTTLQAQQFNRANCLLITHTTPFEAWNSDAMYAFVALAFLLLNIKLNKSSGSQ